MKYKLDKSSQQEVLDQITKLESSLEDVNIQVKLFIYLNFYKLKYAFIHNLFVTDMY